ncbi:hypothetical protein KKG61_00670 [bacterium]|nr:hypothetical protein [bacterium]MBU1598614.1 hypothetical protein [bacterium]
MTEPLYSTIIRPSFRIQTTTLAKAKENLTYAGLIVIPSILVRIGHFYFGITLQKISLDENVRFEIK